MNEQIELLDDKKLDAITNGYCDDDIMVLIKMFAHMYLELGEVVCAINAVHLIKKLNMRR